MAQAVDDVQLQGQDVTLWSGQDRKTWLMGQFFAGDKNGDRTLDKQESEAVINKLGLEGEKDDLFKLFDKNDDGKITLNEFFTAMDELLDKKCKAEPSVAFVFNIFGMHELNDNDGKAYEIEHDEFVSSLEKQKQSKEDSEKLWDAIKKNDKNSVTFEDFAAYVTNIKIDENNNKE